MKLDLTRPSKLYRYSEKRWLDRSLRYGEFLLKPASSYRAMEGVAARTDDELHRQRVLRNPTITHVKTGKPIIPIGDVTVSSDVGTDYLVLCFATIYSEHFYREFTGSDACLVINEPNEFFNRMYKAMDSVIPHNWGAVDAAVTYGGSSKLGAPFSKPEKFLFQFEWRFACLPSPSVAECEATMISLGSIEDIAEVVSAQHEGMQLTSHSSGRP